MSPTNGLRIAVPRGALLGPTLDALDGLGVDTSEVRSNDRKLLFEDVGIITMRPSDVPTYVEAGAAESVRLRPGDGQRSNATAAGPSGAELQLEVEIELDTGVEPRQLGKRREVGRTGKEAVELGAERLIPLLSKRSVVQPDADVVARHHRRAAGRTAEQRRAELERLLLDRV